MLRAIVLSIALLVGFGGTFVLTTDYTEAGAHKPRKQKKKKAKYKKYSRAWWRTYRQRVKRQRELAQRRRAMRLRQIRLSRANNQPNNQTTQVSKANKNRPVVESKQAVLPTGETAPFGWKQGNSSSSELNYRVEDENGSQIGSASISLVGTAANTENNQSSNPRNKTLGGISVNSFRSSVIDRMIKENGWVVNDYQKEIGGKKVYVVVAQSEGAGGVILSRTFYFTEVDGRIYSVSTTSNTNSAEKITQESEKVIDSLQRTKSNPQQASNEKE
jgi:hypothetical protein